MTDHTWREPITTESTIGMDGRLMHLAVFADGIERLALVSKLCFVSYLVGPGVKIRLGGRRPLIP